MLAPTFSDDVAPDVIKLLSEARLADPSARPSLSQLKNVLSAHLRRTLDALGYTPPANA